MRNSQVLVWRNRLSTPSDAPSFEHEASLYGLSRATDGQVRFWQPPQQCPFCKTRMQIGDQTVVDDIQIDINQYDRVCSFCHYRPTLVEELRYTARDMRMEMGAANIKRQWLHRPVLKSLDINDSSIAFNELGSWIAKYKDQMYSLTPRKFEELVADIFKTGKGFDVRLTQSSKDGGIDMYLLENDGTQAIVQVKRNRLDRKIGVELIDQVRGLKLRRENHKVAKAYIVTSSSFTSGALKLAANPPTFTKFDLELIDCERLLRELSCYGGGPASLSNVVRARLRS